LPTETELCQANRVSTSVVRQVFNTLANEGLITSQQGKGRFVAERIELTRQLTSRYGYGRKPTQIEEDFGGYEYQVDTEVRQISASKLIAELLEIPTGAMVSEAAYTWRVAGEVTQISTQWEPLDITRGTSAETPAVTSEDPGVFDRFLAIDRPIAHTSEEIRIRIPDPILAQQLMMSTGVPIFDIRRVHIDYTGRPVEAALIFARGDRYKLKASQDHELPPDWIRLDSPN
jgi:GntR family transcriptional regulator